MNNRGAAVILACGMAVAWAAPLTCGAQQVRLIPIHPPNPPVRHGGGWRNVNYPGPEKRAENLAKLLALSDEQKEKVQALFIDQDKQSDDIWQDTSLPPAQRTQKLDDLRDATVKKVREILTEEQRKKYDAIAPAAAPRRVGQYVGP